MSVEEIAKGLTKAQRRAISDAVGGGDIFVIRWEYHRSNRAMCAKGIVYREQMPGVLTPLGQSVRAYLKEQSDD